MDRAASVVRGVALVAAVLCTVVVAYFVVYVFAQPECVSYGRGRQVVHQLAMVVASIATVGAWVVLSPRRPATWTLPFVIVAVLVLSFGGADVLADAYDFDEDAAACM